MKHTNPSSNINTNTNTDDATTTRAPRRASRPARRRTKVLIGLAVLAAASAVTSCSITIDGFAQEAATELGENVGRAVAAAAADTGRETTDYDLVASALHTVIDLDDYEDEGYRPTHTGLSDADGDGLDDDGTVEIRVAGARACVHLDGSRQGDGEIEVDHGRCAHS